MYPGCQSSDCVCSLQSSRGCQVLSSSLVLSVYLLIIAGFHEGLGWQSCLTSILSNWVKPPGECGHLCFGCSPMNLFGEVRSSSFYWAPCLCSALFSSEWKRHCTLHNEIVDNSAFLWTVELRIVLKDCLILLLKDKYKLCTRLDESLWNCELMLRATWFSLNMREKGVIFL